jgi:cyclopropane fatty-acyl-phospholipid synthase-like methyltransferase
LSDQIIVLFSDYHDLTGLYDKLVSREIIEAVGHQYFDSYFGKCSVLLESDGILPYPLSREKMHRTKAKSIHKKTFPLKAAESGKTKTRMAPEPAALIMSGFFNF